MLSPFFTLLLLFLHFIFLKLYSHHLLGVNLKLIIIISMCFLVGCAWGFSISGIFFTSQDFVFFWEHCTASLYFLL